MLVLSRKKRETVVVGRSGNLAPHVTITVLAIQGNKVKLGFEVDADVPVHRLEVWERIKLEDQLGKQMEASLDPVES